MNTYFEFLYVFHCACLLVHVIIWIHTIMPWNYLKFNCSLTVINHTMKNVFSSGRLKTWNSKHNLSQSMISYTYQPLQIICTETVLATTCICCSLLVNNSVSFSAEDQSPSGRGPKVHHASLYIISYYELAYWNQYMTQYEQ